MPRSIVDTLKNPAGSALVGAVLIFRAFGTSADSGTLPNATELKLDPTDATGAVNEVLEAGEYGVYIQQDGGETWLGNATVTDGAESQTIADILAASEPVSSALQSYINSVAAPKRLPAINDTDADRQLVAADEDRTLKVNNAGACTRTIPADSIEDIPEGAVIGGYQQGAGQLTLLAGDSPAQGAVELTGGAGGSVDSITVDGVEIMSGAEAFDTDLETTAANVAANILANVSIPDYSATANGAVIVITAETGGTGPNGFVVASGTTTITTADTNLSGGEEVTLNSPGGLVSTNQQFSPWALQKVGPNEWNLIGDLA